VALTIVLLAGGGLMIRSFLKLYTLDLGIRTENLMAMRIELPPARYSSPESRRAFFNQLEPRLAAIPGVQQLAVSTFVPPLGSLPRPLWIEGRQAPASGETPDNVATVSISPGFFETIGVPARRGRVFVDTDGATGSESVIVNERFAAMYFPGEEPLGRRIRFNEGDRWRTIVGITPSIRHDMQEAEPAPAVYTPFHENTPGGASLIIRSPIAPAAVMDAVRREVQAIDRDQPVFTIQTLDQLLQQERWGIRTFGGVFVVFAGIALALSLVGLYAVMAYAVTQRTQEIGVRMALGARSNEVSWLILKRGLAQLAIGLAIGLPAALGLSGILQRALVQVTPADPLTFVAITMLLAGAGLAACLIPARRATRIDPLAAMRVE
jgi:predicted permease